LGKEIIRHYNLER